jgi:hypothetical protein
MKNIARRMFTGQRERDVSVGMDSKTMLWDLLGPILARDFQKKSSCVYGFYPYVYAFHSFTVMSMVVPEFAFS